MVFSEKYYILFAGANGTGKSTLRASLPHLCDLPYVNADEIARGLGECDSRITLLKAAKEALLLVNTYADCASGKKWRSWNLG